jgi:Leucine-rich repeat (LRR) protein
MNKPKEILELEDIYGITLEESKLSLKHSYAVDKKGFVIRLNLSDNQLTEIKGLEKFANLQQLYLSNNQLTEIKGLEMLANLQQLYLSNNQLTEINGLEKLVNLKKLDLSSNQLTETKGLEKLVNLQGLYLSNNQLTEIKGLKNLVNLKQLYLSRNQLTEISGLENLVNLQQSHLSNNQLTKINGLKKLVNLKQLHLSNNQLTEIKGLEKFANLQQLYLSNNQLTEIKWLEKLVNLKLLRLENNSISNMLPLKQLKQLKQLGLSYNRIKELPEWVTCFNVTIKYEDSDKFHFYPITQVFNFYGNPLETPDINTVKQGNDAIKRYFERAKKEGTISVHEAKLILVGDGGAGKTSLQVRLMDEAADLPTLDERTRGIKTHDWQFKENYIAHIWDFGGQDVYFPVHRFFLTDTSVFVLLASTRTNDHHNFEYWIPTIYQFGGSSSPIIIGQTCHDGNMEPWDLNMYLGNPVFNIIRTQLQPPYHELNLKDGNKGLDTIREVIISQLEHLPHCRKEVLVSRVIIREALKKKAEQVSHISYDEFKQLCDDLLTEHPFTTPDEYADCCEFFSNIGVVLWYRYYKRLKDCVILRPQWVMDAVYRIIDDEQIQERRGLILESDFDRLWDRQYADKHDLLKDMLSAFRVAFRWHNEEYIIPCRLWPVPTDKKWTDGKYINVEYHYDFMPKGLLNQVSAVLSHYINEEVWSNAVNFKYSDDTYCQMEEDFFKKIITIKAKGGFARDIISIVIYTLDDISSKYKGIKPEKYVPCNCRECRDNITPEPFIYSKLIKWKSQGKEIIRCNNSNEDIYIDDLLYDTGFSANKHINKEQMREIKIFLASSSELKADREAFEIFINRENKELIKQGIFLRLELWEDFLDCMSLTRIQNEYNKAVKSSDIFVSLFFTKAGKYTDEEFDTAYGQFIKTGKPLVYVYIKNATINSNEINKDDMNSLFEFKEKLKELDHYPTQYLNIEDLKYQFKKQLEILINDNMI